MASGYAGKTLLPGSLNVEADEVRAQQAVQQLTLPRANAEGFRIRPGNMPEDGHARVGMLGLDHGG